MITLLVNKNLRQMKTNKLNYEVIYNEYLEAGEASLKSFSKNRNYSSERV